MNELKEPSTPLDTSQHKSPGAPGPIGGIRRAYLAMQRCGDAWFSSRKTTTDQYALLWVVSRRQGIRQNELAAELFTDPNTVTAMVVRLEKRGVIRREVCPDDGRARRVSLTPSGRRLLAHLSADWEPMRRKLREAFVGEGGPEALRILDNVRKIMMEGREEFLEKKASRKRRSAVTPRRMASDSDEHRSAPLATASPGP
jgi:DNA-binding MarR family transcriptional regulator